MSEAQSMRDGHRRARSVRGPEWCCQDCSLRAGHYVEWPCPGALLTTFALLGINYGPATTGGKSSVEVFDKRTGDC